jgi:hypothetical protein
MVVQYRFDQLGILIGLIAYLVGTLLVIRSIIDTSDATTGWKFFWSAVVVSFPIIGFFAWLVLEKLPMNRRSKE